MNSQKSKDKRQKPLSTLSASGLSTLNPKGGLIVGITGGIGSGKSTIARELAKRGFSVYDCDREAKRIIAEDDAVRHAVIALLGEEAFAGGSYNTAYVAQRVFDHPELLAALNGIIHPAVKEDIQQSAKSDLRQPSDTLFIESAILFEAGLDKLCDKIVVVDAPEEMRMARTIARDYHGETTEATIHKVQARMRAQKKASASAEALQKPVLTVVNDGVSILSGIVDLICDFAAC